VERVRFQAQDIVIFMPKEEPDAEEAAVAEDVLPSRWEGTVDVVDGSRVEHKHAREKVDTELRNAIYTI
jgi:hypothetical protein